LHIARRAQLVLSRTPRSIMLLLLLLLLLSPPLQRGSMF
jgi:hypothetical protein